MAQPIFEISPKLLDFINSNEMQVLSDLTAGLNAAQQKLIESRTSNQDNTSKELHELINNTTGDSVPISELRRILAQSQNNNNNVQIQSLDNQNIANMHNNNNNNELQPRTFDNQPNNNNNNYVQYHPIDPIDNQSNHNNGEDEDGDYQMSEFEI